jgi:TonB family protein
MHVAGHRWKTAALLIGVQRWLFLFAPEAAAQEAELQEPVLVAPRLVEGEPPPCPEGTAVEARVVVSLVIDETGHVVEAEVVESGGEAFDLPVLERVRGFTFEPATSDGEAIPARIRLAFRFAPPQPLEPTTAGTGTAASASVTPTTTPFTFTSPSTTTTTTTEDEGTLVGQVFERGTRDVLADARVEVGGQVLFVDADGRFEVRLPEGTHELVLVQEGYRPLHTTVEIEAGRRLELALRLDLEHGSHPFETVIHGRRAEEEVTRVSLGDEEIRNLPGTMGDPFRSIEALPGVTPVITGLPYYYVRGAPPSGTGFYLDGVRVPSLFHLALGPAVIHPSLIDRIDFFPGGAPAELGRTIGGMVRAETRLPRADRWRTEWDLRLVDVGALVEVPLTDELRLAVSGRYSYSGWLIKLFDEKAYLQYWDYQARLEWEPARGHRIVLFGFGSFDQAGEEEEDGTIDGPALQFHRVDLRYVYTVPGELRLEAAGWFGYDSSSMDPDAVFDMWAVGPRVSVTWTPLPWLDVSGGVDVEVRHFPPTGLDPADDLAPLVRERDALLVGTYAEATIRPTDATDIDLGVRMDMHQVADRAEAWFDVRLGVRHQLTDWLWLKGAAGTFHQPKSFFIDLPGLGSFVVDSGPQFAYQLSQGVEIALPWSLGLDVQFYYSDFANLTELDIGSDDFGGFPDDPSDDDLAGLFRALDGRAYGLEILLRRRLGEDLFGWIAYTVGRSERDYRSGRATDDFDQTHVLNLVLSWNVGRGWRLGARFHFRSGRPYTPFAPAGDICLPTDSRNAERLPPFYRLDLRVDKKWTFETWWFALYFEFINVTFTPEPYSMECSPYETPSVWLREIPYIVIPTLGFRGVY